MTWLLTSSGRTLQHSEFFRHEALVGHSHSTMSCSLHHYTPPVGQVSVLAGPRTHCGPPAFPYFIREAYLEGSRSAIFRCYRRHAEDRINACERALAQINHASAVMDQPISYIRMFIQWQFIGLSLEAWSQYALDYSSARLGNVVETIEPELFHW